MQVHRTTWLVTPQVTVAGTDYLGKTPAEVLDSMGSLLVRIADVLHRQHATEGLVLVDEAAAARLGLTEPVDADGRQRAQDAAARAGYQSGKLGPYVMFYAKGRPTVHVGRAEVIVAHAQATDPALWPWDPVWHPEITTGLQHWHRLTGVAWQAGPAVMGLEIMHRTMTPYRIAGMKGQRRPDLRDESTPHDAVEAVWSPEMWSRARGGRFLHGYDKRRAGLTAAGVAKLSPSKLIRRRQEYSPKLAGWWHVTVSPWALSDKLPHPMGPGAMDKHRKSMWVTTGTMDLCAELAELGVLSMPEVIDSLTGPARQVLGPWQQCLERAYGEPITDDYKHPTRVRVQEAVKTVAVRSLGMLGKADGRSSIWRPDWFHGVNGVKRSNTWRRAWDIGQREDRWPAAITDDCLWYASDDADPLRSAPGGLQLGADIAGGYRIQGTAEEKRK